MSTSNHVAVSGCATTAQLLGQPTARARRPHLVATEAAAGVLLAVGAAALWSPGDLWMVRTSFHPVWIAILVLAATYGARGLFWALVLAATTLLGASVALGNPLGGLWARTATAVDLAPLGAAVLVAWIAMLHQGRQSSAGLRLAGAEQRQGLAEATSTALRESLGVLRVRHDRIEMSLSMWRELAGRLEHGDPAQAGLAALELCALRSGAAAGIVQRWDGVSLRPLVWRGQWSPSQRRPRDIHSDVVAAAAVAQRRAVPAFEIPGAGTEDSDVAVPILGAQGQVLGVIALRGVSPAHLREADLRDVALIAQWLAPALNQAPALRNQPLRSSELAVST